MEELSDSSSSSRKLTIGEVAAATGLSPITIRRYETRGWLKPRRDWRRHRLYTQADVDLLVKIRDGLVDPRNDGQAGNGG